MPGQTSLFGSGGPLDSPLEGQLLWDPALFMPALARSCRLYFYFLLI